MSCMDDLNIPCAVSNSNYKWCYFSSDHMLYHLRLNVMIIILHEYLFSDKAYCIASPLATYQNLRKPKNYFLPNKIILTKVLYYTVIRNPLNSWNILLINLQAKKAVKFQFLNTYKPWMTFLPKITVIKQ